MDNELEKKYKPPHPCKHCGKALKDNAESFCDSNCRNTYVVESCTMWPTMFNTPVMQG